MTYKHRFKTETDRMKEIKVEWHKRRLLLVAGRMTHCEITVYADDFNYIVNLTTNNVLLYISRFAVFIIKTHAISSYEHGIFIGCNDNNVLFAFVRVSMHEI